MKSRCAEPKNGFNALKPFAQAISGHLRRALRARLPMLREVIEISEKEVFTIGKVVQEIREESKQQVADLEMVDQRIGRAGVRALDGPATMFASMQDLQKAHAAFVKFCETVDAQLVKHEELANVAFKSVRSIAEIASRIDQIGMSAILLTINARVESAHLGAAGRRFNVIADELRELTKDVKSSSNDIARMSAELMTVIPSIAEHAVRLRESHNQASLDLAVQIAGVSESQRLTLERVEVVVRDGRLRADRVVTQLHEVVGRLQFQDLMSQRITAVANQEIASANLMERALSVAADGGTPESVDFAKQAAAAEHLSHACSPAERAARAGTDGVEDSGLARGETLFF